MDQKDEHKDDCRFETDECDLEDSLCCCYIMDEEGRYDTPCFTPVEEMCCC